MGMSIDEAIEHGKEQLEIFGGTHKEFIETSLETMRKYQKFQDQSLSLYMERLNADMVAMLTEIQLEIEEQKRDELSYQQTWNHPLNVCISIIQQKIKALEKI